MATRDSIQLSRALFERLSNAGWVYITRLGNPYLDLGPIWVPVEVQEVKHG